MADGRGFQAFVIGHDDGHRRIELAKTAHYPVLATFLVITLYAHGFEQLDGNFDLALAVNAFITAPHGDLTLNLSPGKHPFRIALANAFQRFAGDDMKKPGLGIHGRGRALGDFDDVPDNLPGHRVGFIATDASPFVNQGLEIHTYSLTKTLYGNFRSIITAIAAWRKLCSLGKTPNFGDIATIFSL